MKVWRSKRSSQQQMGTCLSGHVCLVQITTADSWNQEGLLNQTAIQLGSRVTPCYLKFLNNGTLDMEKHLIICYLVKSNFSKVCEANSEKSEASLIDCIRLNNLHTALTILARLLGIARKNFFKDWRLSNLNIALVVEAETLFIKEAQSAVDVKYPDYKRLNPV